MNALRPSPGLWSDLRAIADLVFRTVARICAVGLAALFLWWGIFQPAPRIVSVRPPITNAGVDAQGRSLETAGVTPETWQPVPVRAFRAGDMLRIWKHQCYFHKSAGTLQFSFIGKNGTVRHLDPFYPPKRTPHGHCARANHAIRIPPDLPPGEYTFGGDAIFEMNWMRPHVPVPFAPVEITVLPAAK